MIFQSTHPRGVRPSCVRYFHACSTISIHAPTWGATTGKWHGYLIIEISIHAPTWGATLMLIAYDAVLIISIHAPTWGATFRSDCADRSRGFQSTHPRGVRHKGTIARHSEMYFNPRTHVGCDKELAVLRHFRMVFQSTHPRGVRLCGANKSIKL